MSLLYRYSRRLAGLLLLALAAGLVSPGLGERVSRASIGLADSSSVPAYHRHPPRRPLPATLDPDQFADPLVRNAYALAGRIRKVLYQQPCYCHCDRGYGHKSLLDCFTGKHASVCIWCQAEAIYAYQQTRRGKSASEIRRGMEAGEWRKVALQRFSSPPSSR